MGMYAPCFGKIGMTMQGLKLPLDQGKLERFLISLQASKDTSSPSILVPSVLLALFLTECVTPIISWGREGGQIDPKIFEALWGPSSFSKIDQVIAIFPKIISQQIDRKCLDVSSYSEH